MKMRITIDVERVGADLTDADLRRAAVAVAHTVEVKDEECDPLIGASLGNGLRWGYCVEEVRP